MTVAPTGGLCDFDLHGFVRVRLVDASVADVSAVRRQVGLDPVACSGEADLTVRFTDKLADGALTYVGVHDAGFTGDEFVILRAKGGTSFKTLLPFDRIGQRPEIVCESGIPAVPHLLAVINLTALGKGILPLHASAFNLEGHGILVTGWAKSGKTEALLAAAGRGAHYVGDEWIFVTPDRTMLGLPEPIRLWGWHLDQLPSVWRSLDRSERSKVNSWRSLAKLTERASGAPAVGGALVRKALPILQRQAYVQVPPSELFGPDNIDLRGSLDAVVLLFSAASPGIVTGRGEPGEVAARMAASLLDERDPLMLHYRQFLYAFPDRMSDAVEHANVAERQLLHTLFEGSPTVTVAHPYPCDIQGLGDAVIEAALGSKNGEGCVSVGVPR